MIGEYPALSSENIAAIGLQKLTLESGLSLHDVTISVEHLGLLES